MYIANYYTVLNSELYNLAIFENFFNNQLPLKNLIFLKSSILLV
jgi:hypothetical protein